MNILKKAFRFAFADGGSIKARVLRSGIWVGASEVMVQTLSLGRSIVFARLLSPEVFGLMGLAGVVIGAIETFTRPGIGQALVARKSSFDAASPTAFTLLIIRGVVLAACLAAAAPWVADFFKEEQLTPVLSALSLTFILASLNNINTISKQRELDFRRLVYIGQSATVVSTIVSVVLAFFLRNVWALVIGQLVSVACSASLSYVLVSGRIRFELRAEVARELLGYGKFITASSVVIFAAQQLDSALIGKLLGTKQLGFYSLALTISTLVMVNVSRVASNVMFPAFSKLQADKTALRQAYLRVLSLIMYIVFPACAGLVIMARPIVRIVYGENWLPAVLPLQILAFFAAIRALFSFTGYMFEGIAMPRISLQLGTFRLFALAILIVPMTKAFGLAGTACAVMLASAVQWFGCVFYVRRLLDVNMFTIASQMWRPAWSASVMALLVIAANSVVMPRSVLSLLTVILIGVGCYAVINISVIRSFARERV